MKMIWNKRGNCAVLFTIAEPRIKAMQFYFLQEKKTKTKEQQKTKFVWGRGMGCVYNLYTFIGL